MGGVSNKILRWIMALRHARQPRIYHSRMRAAGAEIRLLDKPAGDPFPIKSLMSTE
jgi:hypothetical protein